MADNVPEHTVSETVCNDGKAGMTKWTQLRRLMRKPLLLWAIALLAVAGPLAPPPAWAQTQSSVFSVSAVPVDVTSASAAAAREQARADGERRAFSMLLQRLVQKDDWARLPKVSDADLTEFLQDFEVDDEHTSPVRYLAKLTFRFRPEPVRRVLRDAGIPFTETRSKPLIVVPVWHVNSQSVLWDDANSQPNPWRAAWNKAPLDDGLVPMKLPLGELADIQAIDADHAVSGDKAALLTIAHRYDDGDVLVTQATLSGAGNGRILDLTATRFGAGYQDQTWVGSLKADAGETDDDFLTRGVASVIADVSESWKKATVFRPGGAAKMVASVPVTKLEDWVAVRSRLDGIPAIQSTALVTLSRTGARIEIRYLGDSSQLQLALAQRDLVLAPGDPDWTLEAKPPSGQ